MDGMIYVTVNWNKEEDRVEVEPSSIELTDAVDWVRWIAHGTGPEGVNPRPDVTVSFPGSVSRGPFKKLVADHGSMWGSGNRGPRRKAGANRHSYEVVAQTPDGPKCGHGLVINRATRAKPAKPRGGHPEAPTPPPGPPDTRVRS